MVAWSHPPMRWLESSFSATEVSACKALEGDAEGIAQTAFWTLLRAGIFGAGIALAGERNVGTLAKQALGASVAVTGFVLLWSGATKSGDDCETLPSMSAAHRLHEDFFDGIGPVLGTIVIRSALIGFGIAIAGERDLGKLGKKTLGSVGLLEGVILASGKK